MDTPVDTNAVDNLEFEIQFSNFLCLGDGYDFSSQDKFKTQQYEHVNKKAKIDTESASHFTEPTATERYYEHKLSEKEKKSRREIYKNDDVNALLEFNSKSRINRHVRGLSVYPREIFSTVLTDTNNAASPLLKSLYDCPILLGFSLEPHTQITTICALAVPLMEPKTGYKNMDRSAIYREHKAMIDDLISPCYTFKLIVKFRGVSVCPTEKDELVLSYKVKQTPVKYYELVSIQEKRPYCVSYSGFRYNVKPETTLSEQSNTQVEEIDIAQNIGTVLTWLTVSPLVFFLDFVKRLGAVNNVHPLVLNILKTFHTCSEYFKVVPRKDVYHFVDILGIIDIGVSTTCISYLTCAFGCHYNRNVKNLVYKSTVAFLSRLNKQIKEDKMYFGTIFRRGEREGAFFVMPTSTGQNFVRNDNALVKKLIANQEKTTKDEDNGMEVDTSAEDIQPMSNAEFNQYNTEMKSLNRDYSSSSESVGYVSYQSSINEIGKQNSDYSIANAAAKKDNFHKYNLNSAIFTPVFGREFIGIIDEYIKRDGKSHPDITLVSPEANLFKDVCRPISFFMFINFITSMECYMYETHFKHNRRVYFRNGIPTRVRNVYAPDSNSGLNPWAWVLQSCNDISNSLSYDIKKTTDSTKDENLQLVAMFFNRILDHTNRETPYLPTLLIASSYLYSEIKGKTGLTSSSYVSYDIYEWVFRIPKIYESFKFVFSDKSLDFILKFGHNLETVIEPADNMAFFKEYTKIFTYCCNTIAFLTTSLVLVKYHLQKNKTSSGGFVFFNKFDTLKIFIQHSKMLNAFCQMSKYPSLVYRLFMVMLSEAHHLFPTVVNLFVQEASFLQKKLLFTVGLPVFNFNRLVQSISDVYIKHISDSDIKKSIVDLNSLCKNFKDLFFPELAKRIFVDANTAENLQKTSDSSTPIDDDVPTRPKEDNQDDAMFDNAQSNMSTFLNVMSSVTSTSTEMVQYTTNPDSSKLRHKTLFEIHIDVLSSSNTETSYAFVPLVLGKNNANSTDASVFFGLFSKFKPEFEIPEFVVSNKDVALCSNSITEFLSKFIKSVATSKKTPKILDFLNILRSGRITSIYQTKFSSLNFLTDLEPKDHCQLEYNAFKSILCGDLLPPNDIKNITSLIITTCNGNRRNAFVNFAKILPVFQSHGHSSTAGKTCSYNILTVEKISSSPDIFTKLLQVKPKYHNIIFDAMHCWTLSECKIIFEFLNTYISSIAHTFCSLYFISNSNTVKDFGYDITKDLARFLHTVNILKTPNDDILTVPWMTNQQKNDNVESKKSSNIDSYHIDDHILRGNYFEISKNDEIFDIKSRKDQLEHNKNRFKYIYDTLTNCIAQTKTVDERSMNGPLKNFGTETVAKEKIVTQVRNTIYEKGVPEDPNKNSEIHSSDIRMTSSISQKRKLALVYDSNNNEPLVFLDDIYVDSSQMSQRQSTYFDTPLNSSLACPQNLNHLIKFLSSNFKDEIIAVVVGYKVMTKYSDLKTLENVIKEHTNQKSELFSFYNWCCRGNYLRKLKETSSEATSQQTFSSVIFFAIDNVNRLSAEAHQLNLDTTLPETIKNSYISNAQNDRLSADEIKEKMCYALNRAVECSTGNIFVESYEKYINDIFTEISKDDSTKRFTKTVYFTSRGQKTSILFENLCALLHSFE